MQSFLELSKQRYSCRKYSDKPVERELIEKCLEAARLSPSACNSQPWKYYVITDPEQRAAVTAGMAEMNFNPFIGQAPVIIALTEDEEPNVMPRLKEAGMSHKYAYFDLGLSVAHLTLQAAELGLGSIILGLFPEKVLREVTGMPEGDALRMLVLLGWPAEEGIPEKKRLPLEETAVFL
ncbi:MAG: nitroreductase family protein [Firmicutes bacterium]|nr:nitroreductase family protein [Bacillota bacterium]